VDCLEPAVTTEDPGILRKQNGSGATPSRNAQYQARWREKTFRELEAETGDTLMRETETIYTEEEHLLAELSEEGATEEGLRSARLEMDARGRCDETNRGRETAKRVIRGVLDNDQRCLARAFELAYRLGAIAIPIHHEIPDNCNSELLPSICEKAGAHYHPKGEPVALEGFQPVIAILWEEGCETAHALFTFDLCWLNNNNCLPHGVHSIVTFPGYSWRN
jgi:hypothetical protein